MQRSQIVTWVWLGLLTLTLIVGLALLGGEVAALRAELAVLSGARPPAAAVTGAPALPTPATNTGQAAPWGGALSVRVTAAGVSTPTASTTLSITVRGSGAADPLLDLPLLTCGTWRYEVTGASLERARTDLLALILQGEAQTALTFGGVADLTQDCVLTLNPRQDPLSIVAPRLEALVPRAAPE